MWQSIETAPKDGTWVLLTGGNVEYGWGGDTQPPVVCAQWSEERSRWHFAWYDGGYYGEYESPTRWMVVGAAQCS